MGLTSFRSSELKRINGPYLFKIIGLHQSLEKKDLYKSSGILILDG